MTVAALPGNVRLRAFQLGIQTTFTGAVAATRRFPWRFAPSDDLHVTFPTADTGTLPQAIKPYRLASDIDGQITGSLAFNDATYLLSMAIKGGVTGGAGPAYSYTFTPASTSQEAFDVYTAEWGDETTDGYQYTGMVVNRLQLQYPQDLGPIQVTADTYAANVATMNPKTSLQVDFNPTWAFAADTQVYLDDTAGNIETTPLSNVFHNLTIDYNNNLDKKRFLNGSNTRFQLAGFGRGMPTVTATFTGAKNTAWIAEVANWLAADPTERFIGVKTVSPTTVGGSPYSLDFRFPGYWFTRVPGTYATNNTTNDMELRNILDQTLTYHFTATVVNGLASL